MIFRLLMIVLTLAILLAATVNDASGQLASNKETLVGHHSVFVSVSVPESDAAGRRLGLKKDSLERFVLRRLAKSQIEASTTFTSQTLILEIHVDLLSVIQSDELDVYAFVSQFEAIQAARLAINRQGALATTWRATKFGAVTKEQADLLRDSVVQNLEHFIGDWTEVNASE